MIKHISFDLWMTLIKSHPEFKIKRAELIVKMFDLKKYCDPKDIESKIKSLDKVFDRKNMISGKKISADKMYCKSLQKILPDKSILSENKIKELRNEADKLFVKYKPVFINDNIIEILEYLKISNYSTNLSSNTGFIEGKTLRPILEDLRISNYLDFMIFSDEIEASKPSPHFYRIVQEKANLEKNEILHVGDNPKADYQGAKNYGFEALLITNNNYSIEDVKRKL